MNVIIQVVRLFLFKGGEKMRDVVEIEKNQDGATISYARYERMHQFDFNQLINTLDEYNIIFQHIKNGMGIKKFLEKVKEFEDIENKSPNKVYAITFDILLPYEINTQEKKKRFIQAFKKQLFPDIAIYLNYFVIEYEKGKGTYLKFVVFERQLIDKEKAIRYRNPVYTYKKINGERVKIQTRSTGQIKRDKQGKKVMKYIAFGNKLRFFNFANEFLLKDALSQMIESALNSAFTVKYTDKLQFIKKTVFSSSNRFKRLAALAINRLKHLIEMKLNTLYIPYKKVLDGYIESQYMFAVERRIVFEIKSLFNSIEKIFKENVFVDIDGNVYEINYRYVLLPKLNQNIDAVLNYFDLIFENLKMKIQSILKEKNQNVM